MNQRHREILQSLRSAGEALRQQAENLGSCVEPPLSSPDPSHVSPARYEQLSTAAAVTQLRAATTKLRIWCLPPTT